MRKADDLSDDESVSREERRRWIDSWLNKWHAVTRGAETADLVFVAVRDAIQRFNIPLSLR
jgi:phytoene synthase